MPNQLFGEAVHRAWKGEFDLETDEIRVCLVDEALYTVNLAKGGHDLLNDVATNAILAMAILAGQTWVQAVFDGNDFADTFPDHGGGATGEALLLYKHVQQSQAITAVNQGTRTFTIQEGGGAAVDPVDNMLIEISGSTGNNGTYNIESFTYSAPDTLVTVYESIPSATADGNMLLSDRDQSLLLAYLNSVTGLPITTDGTDDSITWDAQGIFERLAVCP